MSDGKYTLLVDETGLDEKSKRVMYVGCLIDAAVLENLRQRIVRFNSDCLEDPYYSGKSGLVNSPDEARHFADDSESLRNRFIEEVVHETPCRVYAVFDVPKATVRQSKVELFETFIRYVRQVREIKSLDVVIEKSGPDDKYLAECGATFETKAYLPLCIADYYGAVLHRFHEKRLQLLSQGGTLKRRELNGLAFNHYSVLLDRISLEMDLSTQEKSSRRDGRYFFEQIRGIVTDD